MFSVNQPVPAMSSWSTVSGEVARSSQCEDGVVVVATFSVVVAVVYSRHRCVVSTSPRSKDS